MSDAPGSEMDTFDDLLTAGGLPAADETWRQDLLRRTSRVLRRRRRWKRAGFVAALAACYVAGLATMRLWVPRTPGIDEHSEAPLSSGARSQQEAAAGFRPAAPSTVAQLSRRESFVPADVLERWAPVVSEEEPAELYRRVGD